MNKPGKFFEPRGIFGYCHGGPADGQQKFSEADILDVSVFCGMPNGPIRSGLDREAAMSAVAKVFRYVKIPVNRAARHGYEWRFIG